MKNMPAILYTEPVKHIKEQKMTTNTPENVRAAIEELPKDGAGNGSWEHWVKKHQETILTALQSMEERGEGLTIADYEQCFEDHRRLVRELDVALNGEDGAAKQASLCDIVAQVKDIPHTLGLFTRNANPPATRAPDTVGDGYVMVPREPTEEMLEEASFAAFREKIKSCGPNEVANVKEMRKLEYKAMLKAAPKKEGV